MPITSDLELTDVLSILQVHSETVLSRYQVLQWITMNKSLYIKMLIKTKILLIALDLTLVSQHPPGWMTILIGWTLEPNVVVSIRKAQTKIIFVLPVRRLSIVPRSVWVHPEMGFCDPVLKILTDSCLTFLATDRIYSVQKVVWELMIKLWLETMKLGK